MCVSEVKEKRNPEYYMIEAFRRLLHILIPLLKCKRGCIHSCSEQLCPDYV